MIKESNKQRSMNTIRYRVKVYSDTEVRDPIAYFSTVFRDHAEWWTLMDESGDPNCIMVESCGFKVESEEEIEPLYDKITPEMYQSTSRTYRVLN